MDESLHRFLVLTVIGLGSLLTVDLRAEGAPTVSELIQASSTDRLLLRRGIFVLLLALAWSFLGSGECFHLFLGLSNVVRSEELIPSTGLYLGPEAPLSRQVAIHLYACISIHWLKGGSVLDMDTKAATW